MPDEPQRAPGIGRESLPGLARVAATSAVRTSGWALRTYVKANQKLLGVALRPETAPELVDEFREAVRGFLGEDVAERVRDAAAPVTHSPVAQRVADAVPQSLRNETHSAPPRAPEEELRDHGAELLRKSRDVRYTELAHPAHARILEDLAPDEARILRMLLKNGPQPSVDVRTGGPVGMFSSRMIAPGLNMIGARAGVRYRERVPSYLNNLFRLGLIWFSRETLRDPHEYQVVEAQPDVLEAMHSVRAAKLVRRSIHLTPFGIDFCRDALNLPTELPGELPAHSDPDPAKVAAAPESA